MAVSTNSLMMGMTGRVGSTVSYGWRGKWVTRSYSTAPKNPRSEKQQGHRMLFKKEVQLAGRMNWVLRETLDALSAEQGMTACNYFVKRNQAAFSAGEITAVAGKKDADVELVVDWSQLVLSEGPVAPVAFDAPEISGTTLSIDFDQNPRRMPKDNYDRVYLFIYVPDLQMGFFTAPVYRREQRLSVVLPESFGGHEVQMWGMVQDRAGRWSETIYVGCGPLVNRTNNSDTELVDTGLSTKEIAKSTQHNKAVKRKNNTKKKTSLREAPGWSVGDSNSRPLPCEGSALNQLS